MKLARAESGSTGLIIETPRIRFLDIAANLPAVRSTSPTVAAAVADVLPEGGAGSWVPMIEAWDKVSGYFREMLDMVARDESRFRALPIDSVKLRAPLPSPHVRIFALGGNDAEHVRNIVRAITGEDLPADKFRQEKRDGIPPWGFQVMADTVVGPEFPVAPPSGVQKFDYEGEVAVVLAKGGRDLRTGDVKFWGYAAWNDFSIRDARFGIGPQIHRGGLNWALEKNFDSGNACGPWMVVEEQRDLSGLRVQTRVNGKTMQDWSTKDLIYGIDETAALISHYVTLKPGDMLASGTGPGTAAESGRDGNRWLRAGDRVEVEVDGAGILANVIGRW